jgi:hypothetical protein
MRSASDGPPSICGEEVAEGLGRGGEAARHAHAGFGELADHLAERSVLAADRFDIGHAQFSNEAT